MPVLHSHTATTILSFQNYANFDGSIELFIIIAAGSSIFSWSLPFYFGGCWGCRAQPLYSWHSDLIVLCVYLLWPHMNILLYMQKSRLALHNSVKSVVLYKVCGRTLHLANAIIILYRAQTIKFSIFWC